MVTIACVLGRKVKPEGLQDKLQPLVSVHGVSKSKNQSVPVLSSLTKANRVKSVSILSPLEKINRGPNPTVSHRRCHLGHKARPVFVLNSLKMVNDSGKPVVGHRG